MSAPNEFLLSYKRTMRKLIPVVICIAAFIMTDFFLIQGEQSYILIRVISLCFVPGFLMNFSIEIIYTSRNRKLRTLKSLNTGSVQSISLPRSEVKSQLMFKTHIFFIVSNQITFSKFGVATVYKEITFTQTKKNVVDYKYYYIDDIRNDHIERTKYMDLAQFLEVIDSFNGYRDCFDVVSINKIELPSKK